MKKIGDEMLTTNVEEMMAVNTSLETAMPVEKPLPPPLPPHMQQEKINSLIHEHLTDMWLLVTGEDVKADPLANKKYDGRPFAYICDGQMRLLETRPYTLDALRAVGIEMT
jgi:hypothetical protein